MTLPMSKLENTFCLKIKIKKEEEEEEKPRNHCIVVVDIVQGWAYLLGNGYPTLFDLNISGNTRFFMGRR